MSVSALAIGPIQETWTAWTGVNAHCRHCPRPNLVPMRKGRDFSQGQDRFRAVPIDFLLGWSDFCPVPIYFYTERCRRRPQVPLPWVVCHPEKD